MIGVLQYCHTWMAIFWIWRRKIKNIFALYTEHYFIILAHTGLRYPWQLLLGKNNNTKMGKTVVFFLQKNSPNVLLYVNIWPDLTLLFNAFNEIHNVKTAYLQNLRLFTISLFLVWWISKYLIYINKELT